MARPTGDYVEQMLEPGGWPQVDEDVFYDRAAEFTRVFRKVTEALELCQQQRFQVFDGGIWSGGAANAANRELGTTIDQLMVLQNNLAAAISWQKCVAGYVVAAKATIGDVVEDAQKQIDALLEDVWLDGGERNTAIEMLVNGVLGVNVEVLADTAEQILATKAWTPPANSVDVLLDQKAPPSAPPLTEEQEPPMADRAQSASVGSEPVEVEVPPVLETPPSSVPGIPQGELEAAISPAASGAQLTSLGRRGMGRTPASAGSPSRSDGSSSPVDPNSASAPLGPVAASTPIVPAAPGGAAAGSSTWSSAAVGQAPLATPPDAQSAGSPTRPSSRGAASAAIPVSVARAERDAIADAAISYAARRGRGGIDPLRLARRIAAALNAPDSGGAGDFGFFWITAVTNDGAIVVANSYGLAYIPEGVLLPEPVHLASADETIPAVERARWATYPVSAVQGWAAHHNTRLRAIIGTKEQLAHCDPGAAKVVLEADDIPASGTMTGRSRLAVVHPAAAAQLAATPDTGLADLLRPVPADADPPADQRHLLWLEVIKPMFYTDTGREAKHLRALHSYAAHAQQAARKLAHNAAGPAAQRAAVAEGLYWKHLSGLLDAAMTEAR